MVRENNVKLLKAQIGNLEVQVKDYQQIVKELSDKLKLYEQKHGTVSVSYTHLTLQTNREV